MIGNNIYKLRKKRGLSLSELSERSRVSKSYLSNIERNLNQNPSVQILDRISAVLEVELKDLIRIDGKQGTNLQIDNEWIELIKELESSGIHKDKIKEYKTLIEFIKWQEKN
ncbi:XRE family transcriptional regulator of biofilm formation [Bacillus niacini]|uniref:XRE family transcriptional regulator of biofilm formation n=1 Tax=Neobacillus niacini TaxID=86668 RepID=A0A852T7Q7_9BACI|nr:XRE family transcriptional regulator [Neobacillus niacini]NYE03849.1 XRE family transcriptional regulator of biofilm formation [Neobacillus niacini]